MGRTAKPRKRYRPGRIEQDPLEAAAALAALLPPATRDDLTRKLRAAFDTLRKGTATVDDWRALADFLNVGEVLCELSICSDRSAEIHAGHAVLSALDRRHAQRARMVLTGPEIVALELAVDIVAIQLRYCTQGELQRAITTTERRLREVLAGNAPNGAIVREGNNLPASSAGPGASSPISTTRTTRASTAP